jgi:hypothetical protein
MISWYHTGSRLDNSGTAWYYRVEVMEMAKGLAKKYTFWEKGLEVLEWAHNRRAELHYLYPGKVLIGASEEARRTKSRLWSVADEEVRYFHLFPHPVSAAKALQVFFETAHYEDGEAETYPTLVVPYAFEVEAWDTGKVREDEARKEMEKDWCGGWPFEGRFPPKAAFLAAVWFVEG